MSKEFKPNEVMAELCDQTSYALDILGASREALNESNVGKDFKGKVPRSVKMHMMSRALTECVMPDIDHEKLMRGLISVCVFLLEDEDVNLALKIKTDLLDTGKK